MSRISKKNKRYNRIGNVYCFLVFAFIYIPIVVMIIFSFNDQKQNYYWKGFTLDWYEKLFTNSSIVEFLWNSLFVAILATIISVIIGTLGAFGLVRYDFKLRQITSNTLYIPIVVPEIVLAISLLLLYNTIRLPLGFTAIILAHVTFSIPFVIIIMRGRLAGMDLSTEEASMDLGANRITTFFRVTLPMLVPGILSSAFMSFTLSIDDVIISNFVAGPYSTTLPVKILSMVKVGLSPEVNALTTIMVLVMLVGILLNTLVQSLLKKRDLAKANI